MMEKVTCKTCPFWQRDENVRAVANPSGKILTGATVNLEPGLCYGQPPGVVLMPMQTAAGPGGIAVFPQSVRPHTMSDAQACPIHPAMQAWLDVLAAKAAQNIQA